MDYTQLIKSIKNKLKKHQYKIDVLNKTIDLETNIKNDLEANFNERVEFQLIQSTVSKELIEIGNDLERHIEKYKRNKNDSKIRYTIQQLKDKREEKITEYNAKKVEITKEICPL